MPKLTVTANSAVKKTKLHDNNSDPVIESPDNASDSEHDWNALGYMYGATCDGGSNDMGCEPASPYGMAISNWERDYEAKRKLRRHTVDQGSSTFSWPQKP